MPELPDNYLSYFAILALALLSLGLTLHRFTRLRALAVGARDWGAFLVFVVFLNTQIARCCVIPSGSMEPTLQISDRVLVNILTTQLSGVHRGQVVVVKSPESTRRLCKRVVGVAGDTIEVREGRLWLNGAALDEPYLAASMQGEFGPVTVPPGHVFLMGDNRNNSHDSRFFGVVPGNLVEGKVSCVWWPLSRVGRL